jgi:two-component system, OmpR family, sensor histidine kinase ChvG
MEILTRLKPSMGSATATTKPEGRERSLWSSRIARLIFAWNLVAFLALAIGALVLTELRDQLVRGTVESLQMQSALIGSTLAEAATEGDPAPALIEREARATIRRLGVPETLRVRVFTLDGRLVADSDLISDRVLEKPLSKIGDQGGGSPGTWLRGLIAGVARLAETTLIPWRPDFTLAQEVSEAGAGTPVAGQRLSDADRRVVSVSAPIQHVRAVVGVLTIEAGDVEAILQAERRAMLPFIFAAGIVSLGSAVLLALLIARPLRGLAGAADQLRLSGAKRLDVSSFASRKDEIGDLAQALDLMTTTLAERIDANERFAADVSHEIKNPLTSIRSAVETLRNIKDPVAQTRLMGIIASDVGRLDRLITDIARASRLEAETARGDPVEIDLALMLQELVGTYGATRRNGEPPVVFRPRVGHAPVRGQDAPLGQVFRNLIDNAKSFSPESGDVVVSVAVETGAEGKVARIEILDEGPGIPPDNLETIFRRFYTERPKGAAFGGNSGLGLSIARQIITAHNGRIWAENVAGDAPGAVVGARFVVELPLAGKTSRETA